MYGDAIEPNELPELHELHEGADGSRGGRTPVGGPDVPETGDAAIDAALAELLEAQSGSLAGRVEAGERAHRLLQGRLGDLGGA